MLFDDKDFFPIKYLGEQVSFATTERKEGFVLCVVRAAFTTDPFS